MQLSNNSNTRIPAETRECYIAVKSCSNRQADRQSLHQQTAEAATSSKSNEKVRVSITQSAPMCGGGGGGDGALG